MQRSKLKILKYRFNCWIIIIFLIYLIKKPGISSVELQRELPKAMGQR